METVKEFMVAQELRRRLDEIEQRDVQISEDLSATKQAMKSRVESLVKTVSQGAQKFVDDQKKALISILDDLKNSVVRVNLRWPFSSETGTEYRSVSSEENRSALYAAFDEIRQLCEQLNSIDFDEADHPLSYEIDQGALRIVCIDTVTGDRKYCDSEVPKSVSEHAHLYNELLRKLSAKCAEAAGRTEAIASAFMDSLQIPTFRATLERQSSRMYDEYEASKEEELNDLIRTRLVQEDGKVNSSFFRELEVRGAENLPDAQSATNEFHPYMTIGSTDTVFTTPKTESTDLALINSSPFLKKYVSDGRIHVPCILDLQKSGNVLVDLPSGVLSEKTIDFAHQYIQNFLLHQPAIRVNLCLVDIDDQCSFSQYSPLRTINSNVMFGGRIVRNEKEIPTVFDNLCNTMFDIDEQKLQANSVPNLFKFNECSRENPQSIHVVVLADFPERYSDDAISQISKIVTKGNKSGIYTLILRNVNAVTDRGTRKAMVDSAISKIEGACMHMTETSRGYQLGPNSYFTPNNKLSVFDFDQSIMPILKSRSEAMKETAIPLADMFAASDENAKKKIPFSKLIEVPLGKSGGIVQSLKFATSNGPTPHALVIGGSGSGKSNLLHALILSACYRYSPKELQIYLIDFKGGVEFKYYEEHRLPHIRLTGLTSEPEDGVAILTNIRAMLRDRENIFRRNDVADIEGYNELEGVTPMPRILVIIDEVQELFSNERLAAQALVILGEIFKKGRAFGMNILWASQTVPKATGDFKDKVLSQIGTRVCLKLNNANDGEPIDIPPQMVRQLSRPEKGLGIIYDNIDYVEFRVAYAESKDKRSKFVERINTIWEEDVRSMADLEPLFIVGDDAIPLAADGAEKYGTERLPAMLPKSNDEYMLSLGQDYISGKPFHIPVPVRGSRENCWIAGKSVDMLRDLIGYAALSALIENRTNSEMKNRRGKIICFNGELVGKNKDDLFNVLATHFPEEVIQVPSAQDLAEQLLKLYELRKERYQHSGETHDPVFVFIHKLQFLEELLTDSKTYSSASGKADATPISGSADDLLSAFSLSSAPASSGDVTFCDMFKELLARGSDVGIHFIMTLNDPLILPMLREDLGHCSSKIVLVGTPKESVSRMTDNYSAASNTPEKDGVAFCYRGGEMTKFKPYRYEPEEHSDWLKRLVALLNSAPDDSCQRAFIL